MNESLSGQGKTVLVTGVTGFIGRFLVPELLADGWQVIVFARPPVARVVKLLGSSVIVVLSMDEIDEKQPVDACVNLAGEGVFNRRWTSTRKRALVESRIDVTQKLGELFTRLRSKPEVLVSGSAVGFYGSQSGDINLTEQDSVGDDFSADLCRQWEQAARDLESQGVRVCLLRTGIVLHPGHGALAKMLPPFRMGAGGRMGDGRQVISWIHIRDMVRIIGFLLKDASLFGAVNATAPNAVTNNQFSRQLASVLHRPCLLPMPGTILALLLGESSSLLLGGQRVIPARLLEHGFSFEFETLDKALSDFWPGQ